jgi:uncharacterized protein YyaL (SSP411 family)
MLMPNHLAGEASPYLKQHAENPVDWYPWGEEAFAAALRLNLPILLSIGYSTCHWCHVMARESFEDEETAALMNRHFISIKVDREERPDLDQIYQAAHAMLTGRHGGWPLTLFLASDRTPFFAGTYFPKTARYGLPGLRELLAHVATTFHGHETEIGQQNEALRSMLADSLPRGATTEAFDERPLKALRVWLEQAFDPVHGGFGPAPKFPKAADLAFLLRRHAADGDLRALAMAQFTLRHICEGGIHDQLGGGFCRYSVDERWEIPHFEKMLYDNALLLGVLADAWRASGEALFRETAGRAVAWLEREMRAPEGGYYSALDADSEHEEGKFYVWMPQQVAGLLDADEYAIISPHYGLDRGANFEGSYWHFHVVAPLEAVSAKLGISLETARQRLDAARVKLLAARSQRQRPSCDDKILTSWNALMARSLAHAGRVFGVPEWIATARRTADFLRGTMWKNGKLCASYKDGKVHLDAYLDDYAFLLDALLELLQADFRMDELNFACELADALLDEFEDKERGGFYFTGHHHERLICRTKPGADNALPAGNAVAAQVLQRLGHLVGEPRYLAAAERTLRLFYAEIGREPAGYASFLAALEENLAPPQIVVLRGPREEMVKWRDALSRLVSPAALALVIPNGSGELTGCLAKPESASVNAWACQGVSCLPPITNPDFLADLQRR